MSPDAAHPTDTTPRLRLRVLATTDLHAHILPWDDLADREAPDTGLAQVASLIATARAEEKGSLLFDNGDFLNGSPLADHVAETRRPSAAAPHPMVAAMNRLGYDAATLGNHEFSNGLDHLRRSLAQAAFPLVATNLDRITPAGLRPFLPRSLILRRSLLDETGVAHQIAIGVLGFLPPQTALWERRHMAGRLAARGILAAARRALPGLRRAGADLVIALCHSGIGSSDADPCDEMEAENVACLLSRLPGIDAVIAGHTHQLFPPPVALPHDPAAPPAVDTTCPALPGQRQAALIQPGFYGSHLGVMDLTLERGARGWLVSGHRTELRAVSRRSGPRGEVAAAVPTTPEIAACATPDRQAFQRRAAQPVGHTTVALQSYFALIGHSPIDDLLAQAQTANMRRLLADHPDRGLPLLVSVAPFKAGGRGGPLNYTDIAAGPLTLRNIADLYIHPNSPVALRMTGAALADWLERSVSLFRQIRPGAVDACLIDPAFPAYNFEMIHGLSYRIDLSQPARFDSTGRRVNPGARRIVGLCHEGRPLRDNDRFVLATNSYRASGGAGFAGTEPPDIVTEESRPLRRILQEHIAAHAPLCPQPAGGWGFAPMPGTTVCLDSGPGAARHAPAIAGLESLGVQPTGFLRFRLHL